HPITMESVAARAVETARSASLPSSVFRSLFWETVMKPAQWMAVLLLALMVGGITFVMVYLGSSSGPAANTPSPKLGASLTFVQKKYPGEGDKPMTTEVNKTGHQDFWFVNDSGQDVPVGMISKSCTCTQVEVSIAPEGWKSDWAEASAGQVLRQA